MKRFFLFTILFMFAALIHVFACDIVVGQSYEYEWTIINVATGAVIDSGSGTAVPTTDRGFRNIEHYIRRAVLGWNNRTRTVNGVRQRLILTIAECEHGG